MKMKHVMVMLLSLGCLAGSASASVYTIGHLEDGGTRSWLETWDNDFGARTDIVDVGTAKSALFGSPHSALGVGEIYSANPGDEFLLGRSDGIGAIIKKDASLPRLGGALFFRHGTIKHSEDSGLQSIAIKDFAPASVGNEIVTFPNNGIMEVWKYDESAGAIDSRLDLRIWTSISAGARSGPYGPSNPAFDGSAIGDFITGNTGLEVALLRPDGLVEIWDDDASGIWPASAVHRLAIYGLSNGHAPWDHFFAGDLIDTNPGDEIATIGSDGWYEIHDPATGTRFGAFNNAYSKSGHDPFLAVTADPVPEPTTIVLLALGALTALRRRR